MQDVCLFAHFDPDARVDDYVLHYLRKIKELDFSIIFISAAGLSAPMVERLRADCVDVIVRENSGLDFGSWSAGFAKHGPAVGGRLLLANDSVYGPIGSLRAAVERMTRKPADFYGLVESAEIAPHLQSWFVLLEPWVVRHSQFGAILAQPFAAMDKRRIVRNGEVGLSRRLMAAGFRYEALYRADRVRLPRRHDVNAMLLFWRELLVEEGVPFVKIELLRDNPIGSAQAATILQTVQAVDPALPSLIRSHLARAKPRPPRPLLARARYAMIRKRYKRERAGGALNTILLEIVTVPVWMWRALQSLFRRKGLTGPKHF
jgi:lipopolysaccharide biosynthesis protein